MPRVIHFEISAENPESIADFYRELFGWTITKKQSGADDYWLIHTGPQHERGINGGIKRKSKIPYGIAPTMDIESHEEFQAKVKASGGKILGSPIPLPGTGTLVYAADPEGNVFCGLERTA